MKRAGALTIAAALSVAAAAEASGGRFVLGIGAGHRIAAESWFGATWSDPRDHLRETIEVLRRVLSGERGTHDGAFRVQGFHLGSTPPAVPVYMAALTPSSLRLAGEIADGLVLNWLPPEGVEKSALLAREAAADAGRRLRVLAYVRAAVVDDPADDHVAHTAVREQTYAYLSLPSYARSLRTLGYGKDLEAMASGGERAVDGLSRALCAVGDPATVRAKLEAYTQAGVDSVVVYPVAFGDDSAGNVLRTIRALA